MPRRGDRLCRTCNSRHPPPTGKNCPALLEQGDMEPSVVDSTPVAVAPQDNSAVLAAIAALGERNQAQNQAVLDRMELLEQQELATPLDNTRHSRDHSHSRSRRRRRSYSCSTSRSRSRSHHSSRKMKSGEAIDSDLRTKVLVIWPHVGIYKGPARCASPSIS